MHARSSIVSLRIRKLTALWSLSTRSYGSLVSNNSSSMWHLTTSFTFACAPCSELSAISSESGTISKECLPSWCLRMKKVAPSTSSKLWFSSLSIVIQSSRNLLQLSARSCTITVSWRTLSSSHGTIRRRSWTGIAFFTIAKLRKPCEGWSRSLWTGCSKITMQKRTTVRSKKDKTRQQLMTFKKRKRP